MSTSHAIKAHAQEVLEKNGQRLSEAVSRDVVTHNSRSDLPLSTFKKISG